MNANPYCPLKLIRTVMFLPLLFMLFLSTTNGSNVIKVGVILPVSGPLTPFGKSTLEGIKFGIDEINKQNGVKGRPVKLIVEDNKGDKTQSVLAYKKLCGINRVVAVLGPITSTNSLAVANHTRKLKVPTISPTATNDRVAPKSPYMFRACFNDGFQGKVVANYAITHKNFKTAAIITDLGSDYSKGLGISFKKYFSEAGGTVVIEESYQQKDTEFGAQLSRIKTSKAEVIFVPGYPPEVPLIIKQAKVVGVNAAFCGADGWDHDSVISNSGENIIGSFIVGAFSQDDQREAVQKFVQSMGPGVGTFEALGYDAASILIEAMNSGISSEAIKAGLHSIKDFEAVTGIININSKGDAVKSAVIMSIEKDGNAYIKKYKTTLHP